jgi:uncharacterized LabA/DUF88 family protein
LPHPERLNIAVFIDFDNIEIGVKSTLGEHFDVGPILDAIKERGEVVTKIAYADWTRAGEYSRALTQHAIRLVQRNLTPGGDKNGADINLALDALEMAFTHPHINAYVIVGGDSDFLSLVEKLKQYDKKVFVVGGRAFTSVILQRNCHEFMAYENIIGARRPAPRAAGRPVTASAAAPFAQAFPFTQAFPIVRRALKILADREVTPQTGLLKSTLLQLDSTFSERNYGASSFLDFVEKLSQAGFVTLKHSGRSVMVELNEAFREEGEAPRPTAEGDATGSSTVNSVGTVPGAASVTSVAQPPVPAPGFGETATPSLASSGVVPFRPTGEPSSSGGVVPFRPAEPVQATESAAAGVLRAGRLLAGATNARWPMYLRNVKQILRQAEGGFDERRYGFGGLMDLLRACQREGLVRVERDRRGGLRVFQGQALQKANVSQEPVEISGNVAVTPIETHQSEIVDTDETAEIEPQEEMQPVLIDTTAELLGRAGAKPRRTASGGARSRVRPERPIAAARKPAAKKPATKRPSRAKKAAPSSDESQS